MTHVEERLEPERAGISRRNVLRAGAVGAAVVGAGTAKVVMQPSLQARGLLSRDGIFEGASIALAETVASLGAAGRVDRERYAVVGQEINGNHIRAIREGTVRATGTPLHVGRTSQVWSIEITDEQGRLVCISRCTLAVVERRGQ